ncbi:MAG: site-specific DNA-methyltransferase [Candidatus Hatepunaea meridiana]|nr:site-specific DNA-methyltransferase [Candidatus Hatepunaea meridiana]
MKSEKNKLFCGDNLDFLVEMERESVDLIYVDPPFFSNRNYEITWGDEAEITSFKDKWEGGVNVYVDWMKQRVMELHRVLKPTGSFYLHCDWHAGHYLKVMCDEVFGQSNFQNENIWCYRTGGASKKRWSRKHDSIYFYTKSGNYSFKPIKERIYYKKPFFTDKKDDQGRYYADVLPVDWWEIKAVINVSKERINYPTQKPEALLERIIKASSNEGDLILDAFCGCGTSLAVAQKLRRRWIGIDVLPSAIAFTIKRLADINVSQKDIEFIRVPQNVNDFNNETMKQ